MRRHLALASLRVGVITLALFGIYVLAPLGERPDGFIAVELVISLIVFLGVVFWEMAAIVRSSFPGLQAAEAVAVSVPLLILLFSAIYVELAREDLHAFTEPVNRVDAVYFTVTVLATVGFGDITPATAMARLVVTAQMVADLVLVGLIAKVLFGAVQIRRQALAEQPGRPTEKVIPPG
jgi:hypothetical protein